VPATVTIARSPALAVFPVSQPKGCTMTTTDDITESPPTDRPCPSWCVGCTPSAEGGYGHFGDEHSIALSLVAPEKFRDIMHDADSWLPAEVKVWPEQKHGAYFPVIKVATGTRIEDVCLTLTLNEAGDLADLLTVMVPKARRAARDTCEAEMKAAAS